MSQSDNPPNESKKEPGGDECHSEYDERPSPLEIYKSGEYVRQVVSLHFSYVLVRDVTFPILIHKTPSKIVTYTVLEISLLTECTKK